jgi:glutamyl-tRNA synthetase
VFETLNWMKLDWDLGPKSLREHQREYSQALRFNRYLDAVHVLIESGQAFVCSCSRRELQRESCSCKRKTLTFDSKNTVVRAGDSEGDFVIWRREGFAAYHLVSLLDDLDSGVNLIVRGEDLRASTGVQIRLAKMLGRHFEAERFEKVEFIHHPLILGKSGEKLSKSNHALSLRQQFDRKASPDELYREISLNLGIRKPCCSLGELLTVFQE